jgi:WD40 repeat protein
MAVSIMAFTLLGSRLLPGPSAPSHRKTLRVWDLESGKELATFTGESELHSCAVAPDGQTIIAGDNQAECIFCASSKRMKQSREGKLDPQLIPDSLTLESINTELRSKSACSKTLF